MNTLKISEDVLYVGVNDFTTRLFESLWPLPNGVSYNSYVVKGEKTALIDTVEINHLPEMLEKFEAHGIASLDYLIINHMEPDHSGSIAKITERFPNLKIVGNRLTVGMVKGYYGIDDDARYEVVKDGDTLDLGAGKVLTFQTIPMVHWPETMVTWLADERILFSGDAFGTFGALGNGIVDSEISNFPTFVDEMYRYYACIVAKYGPQVQNALKKLAGLDIKYICSTHGPVWHDHAAEVVSIYDRLSSNQSEAGVTLIYGSMYGHTGKMAEIVAKRLEERGVTVKRHNAATSDLSEILADVWRYRGVVMGAPTYNTQIFPPVASALHALQARGLKNRIAGAFGSFTWAGAACKLLTEGLTAMGLEMPAESVEMKMEITPEITGNLQQMADTLANAILRECLNLNQIKD